MKFEISSGAVRAVIVTQPLISVPAFVMNILEPSITHSPSSALRGRARRARVGAGLGLGQAERRERARPRRAAAATRARCRSSPKSTIGMVPSEVCAATVIAKDESTRASSSMQSA